MSETNASIRAWWTCARRYQTNLWFFLSINVHVKYEKNHNRICHHLFSMLIFKVLETFVLWKIAIHWNVDEIFDKLKSEFYRYIINDFKKEQRHFHRNWSFFQMNQNRTKIENIVNEKMKKVLLTVCDKKLKHFCEIHKRSRFKIYFKFLKNRVQAIWSFVEFNDCLSFIDRWTDWTHKSNDENDFALFFRRPLWKKLTKHIISNEICSEYFWKRRHQNIIFRNFVWRKILRFIDSDYS